MDQLLSFPDALDVVLAHARVVPQPTTETVALVEAQGRVLAEAVVADRDQPPFDRSTRDGFAVVASQVSDDATPTERTVLGLVRAGEVWTGKAVTPSTAVEIMTGAPVPEGANAVVMVEHATVSGSTLQIAPGRPPAPGQNIVPRGAELRAGAPAVTRGVRLGAAELAAAASLGAARCSVFRQPRVAILSTGDELVGLEETPAAHQIRNSNTYALAALVQQAGGVADRLSIARDTLQALRLALGEATASADLLLLSGGVSAGKYDLVETALAECGARFHFTGVRMQPGKPVVFGTLPRAGRPDLPFFGLPGNPISTEVTFTCFAAPLLQALAGGSELLPRLALARLDEPTGANASITRLLPARLTSSFTRKATVRITPWQGSGDLAANARSNCFVLLPPGADPLAAGDLVTVLLR